MINDPPDSAARFAASRSARADESEKSTGTNMRRSRAPARRLCVDVFIFMLLISAWQCWPAERRLLTPLHGAKQRATPTLVVPGPGLVAGEFRRRSDRCFVGWPFQTSSLPEFPSRAQRWRLLFVSTEILRSVFSGRPQDSFESPPDWLPMAAALHIPIDVLHPGASWCREQWSLIYRSCPAHLPNPKRHRWRRKNRIPQES